MTLAENLVPVTVLAPDADRYNGNPATDVVVLRDAARVLFVISEGTGTTGTVVVTVESCDDTTPTTTTAIPFRYRLAETVGTLPDWQTATASGFTMPAGGAQDAYIEITHNDLSSGDVGVRLKFTEGVDAATDAGVIAIAGELAFAGENEPSVLA